MNSTTASYVQWSGEPTQSNDKKNVPSSLRRMQKLIAYSPMIIINPNRKWFSYLLISLVILLGCWRGFLSVGSNLYLSGSNGDSFVNQFFSTIAVFLSYSISLLRLWYFGKYVTPSTPLLNKISINNHNLQLVETLCNRAQMLFFMAIIVYTVEILAIWAIYASFYNWVCFLLMFRITLTTFCFVFFAHLLGFLSGTPT